MLQEQDSSIFVGRRFYYVKREAMYEFKSTKKINTTNDDSVMM